MKNRTLHLIFFTWFILFSVHAAYGQCGSPGKDGNQPNLNNFPNTYYSPAASSYFLEANTTTTITLSPAGIASPVTNTAISPGDIVIIIQMQGAAIRTTNDQNYGGNNGTGSGYLHDTSLLAGNYEYAVAADGTNVTAAAGGTLVLATPVKFTYKYADATATSGQYRFQVIKVPQFDYVTLASNIVVPGWNGSTGGALFFEANQTCNMNGFSIVADGKGFRGGGGINYTGTPDFGANNIYRYLSTVTAHASKGEGIAGTPRFTYNGTTVTDNVVEGYASGSFGKGAPANAGGGATDNKPAPSAWDNQLNTGGGGGANAGNGGKGGWPWNNNPGTIDSTENGGRCGSAFSEGSLLRIIMGGGGGAGSANNSAGDNALKSSGAPGGGIISIHARKFSGTGSITANGSDANNITGPSGGYSYADASGGAGAGGTVLLYASDPSGLSAITVSAKGGKGGSNYYGQHGPGGGGSGGVIYSNGTPAAADVTGGLNGQTGPGLGNNNSLDPLSLNYGATAGQNGILVVSSDSVDRSVCIVLSQVNNIMVRAVQVANTVRISWYHYGSSQAVKYGIEHSADGREWNSIGEMMVNNTINSSYSYTHGSPAKGRNYYRIKVDYTVRLQYSETVRLDYSVHLPVIIADRVNNMLTINSTGLREGIYHLQWMDMSGKIIYRLKDIGLRGANSVFSVTWPSQLSPGYYLINLSGPGGFSMSEKVVW